jgi:hypothetical protein
MNLQLVALLCNLVNAQELTLFINILQIRRQFLPVYRNVTCNINLHISFVTTKEALTNPFNNPISLRDKGIKTIHP